MIHIVMTSHHLSSLISWDFPSLLLGIPTSSSFMSLTNLLWSQGICFYLKHFSHKYSYGSLSLPSGLCSKSASLNGSTSLLSVYPAFFRFVRLLLLCTCLESSLGEVILELGIEGWVSRWERGRRESLVKGPACVLLSRSRMPPWRNAGGSAVGVNERKAGQEDGAVWRTHRPGACRSCCLCSCLPAPRPSLWGATLIFHVLQQRFSTLFSCCPPTQGVCLNLVS